MELKEQLIELFKSNPNIKGAISISKQPWTKYYTLRINIIKATTDLPIDYSIAKRINHIILDGQKCECGCNQLLNNPKCKYIFGHSNRSEQIKQKKILSNIIKFGVSNPSQRQDIKDKKKKTMEKNYGNLNNAMLSMKKTYKKTCLKKYNVENVFQIDSIKHIIKNKWQNNKNQIIAKRKETHYKNWKINSQIANKFEFLSNEFNGVDRKFKYKFKCKVCKNIFEDSIDDGKIPRCLVCNPFINSGGQSICEYEIEVFLKSLGFELKIHCRNIINNLELDFFIPEKNLAIEFNGLYWHSELSGKKDYNYHLNKTLECQKKGIQLIHIFEDEWLYKKQIVQSKIKHILGLIKQSIYARKCEVREISNNLKNKFLDKYHIQRHDFSTIKLGLFYKNRLVAVQTFGKRRFDNKDGFELIRYCTIFHFNIVGGAGKLFSYFLKNYNLNKKVIISYADRRWSNGNLYKQLKFKHISNSRPNYFYFTNKTKIERISRMNFQKHMLINQLKTFNKSLSEWQNMQNNGYDRIWDCGNLVYEFNFN